MKDKRLNRIWAVSLMILSVLSIIYGMTAIIGLEIPHSLRMIIAIIQIIVGTILIVTTVLKFRK